MNCWCLWNWLSVSIIILISLALFSFIICFEPSHYRWSKLYLSFKVSMFYFQLCFNICTSFWSYTVMLMKIFWSLACKQCSFLRIHAKECDLKKVHFDTIGRSKSREKILYFEDKYQETKVMIHNWMKYHLLKC